MFLIIFAAVGFFVGFRLETTRGGYVAMALTSVAFFAGEIIHVLTTANRAALTMLPMVIGLILVVCMLVGASVRLVIRHVSKA
jgi:hypothetical protein